MKVGLLVVVKTILYKRTIALGTNIDFRKDLRRSELQFRVLVGRMKYYQMQFDEHLCDI